MFFALFLHKRHISTTLKIASNTETVEVIVSPIINPLFTIEEMPQLPNTKILQIIEECHNGQ